MFSLTNIGFTPRDLEIYLIFQTTHFIAYTIVLFFTNSDRTAVFCYILRKKKDKEIRVYLQFRLKSWFQSCLLHIFLMQLSISLCLICWQSEFDDYCRVMTFQDSLLQKHLECLHQESAEYYITVITIGLSHITQT